SKRRPRITGRRPGRMSARGRLISQFSADGRSSNERRQSMPRTPKKTRPTTDPMTIARGFDPEQLAKDLAEFEGPPTDGLDRSKVAFPANLPVLPIRDQVYFPHMMFPLLVGREKGVRALEEAAALDRRIVIVAQRDI